MAALFHKVLFVCDAHQPRNPTAECPYSDVAGVEVRSAGLASGAPVPVTIELVEWAEIVFVMESRQRNKLHKLVGELFDHTKVICLHIPDDCEFMDPRPVLTHREKFDPYFGLLGD